MTDRPTIIIAASGTGGHVFPGIAIAEAIARQNAFAKVLFVGTENGPEAQLLSKGGWKLAFVGRKSIHSGGLLNQMRTYLKVPAALYRSWNIISKAKPDVVLGIGGFAAGPMVLAAALRGIPTAIVEPNAIAGRTNLRLARFAKKVFAGFDSTARQFPREKAVVTGNPIRNDITHVARHRYNGSKPLSILCYGGSQGAKRLNELMVGALSGLKGYERRICFIHQVGNYTPVNDVSSAYKKAGFSAEVFEFSDHMEKWYELSDFAIARSGAGTIAELMAVKLPAFLVPFPHAVDDHQKANAEEMVRTGGAIMSIESQCSAESLANLIRDLAEHPSRLEAMSDALVPVSRADAADKIAQECMKMIVKSGV